MDGVVMAVLPPVLKKLVVEVVLVLMVKVETPQIVLVMAAREQNTLLLVL
tara:strand:+ start:475 stop:624 length:150 start_codon:yes stop_codon:yes gene_type:complete